jgi:hypothetical protein
MIAADKTRLKSTCAPPPTPHIPPQHSLALPDLPSQPGAYSVPDFLKVYKISRAKLYSEIAKGRIRPMKIGTRTLLSFRACRDWEALCERPSA